MPSDTGGNIFLTTENLAFSMPLIVVTLTYVYFKYLPLRYSLTILGFVFVVYQIRSQILSQQAKRLQNLDQHAMQKIVDELTDENQGGDNVTNGDKATEKARNRIQQRLAQERKAEAKAKNAASSRKKKQGTSNNDQEDDDDDLTMIAKNSRNKAKTT